MTTKEKIEKYAMPNFGVRDFVVSRGKARTFTMKTAKNTWTLEEE